MKNNENTPMSDEELEKLGGKLSQMKILQLAFDKLAEELSKDLNIPIWRIHQTFKNVSDKIIPQQGNFTVATKFMGLPEMGKENE